MSLTSPPLVTLAPGTMLRCTDGYSDCADCRPVLPQSGCRPSVLTFDRCSYSKTAFANLCACSVTARFGIIPLRDTTTLPPHTYSRLSHEQPYSKQQANSTEAPAPRKRSGPVFHPHIR